MKKITSFEQIGGKADEQKPLLEWQGVGRFLDAEPPQEKLLFCGNGWSIPDKCVIAIFAAGGTGKTFLGFQLSACLAAGVNMGPFVVTQQLMPVIRRKVLYICGEDQEEIIHRRLRGIHNHLPGMKENEPFIRENLEIASLVGQDRVLIRLDHNGNPATTEVFGRLKRTIESIKGLDVLILDPLSKFYGLNENDNACGNAWIALLESLVVDYNLSVIFAHHESKSQNSSGRLESSAGRGAGSFRDGIRYALSLEKMSAEEGKRHGIKNYREIVKVLPTKTNYTAQSSGVEYFKHGPCGVLLPFAVVKEQNDSQAEALYQLLFDAMTGKILDDDGKPIPYEPGSLSRRGLERGDKASMLERKVRDRMKEYGDLKEIINRQLLRLETQKKICIRELKNKKQIVYVTALEYMTHSSNEPEQTPPATEGATQPEMQEIIIPVDEPEQSNEKTVQ